MKTLTGHTSKETARVVDDYPYGYRLRCKIRYWMEHKPRFGFRLVSQTTNPKKPGEFWNKPKPSTYAACAVMVETDEGHIEQRGLGLYPSLENAQAFQKEYGQALEGTKAGEMLAVIVGLTSFTASNAEAKIQPSKQFPTATGVTP